MEALVVFSFGLLHGLGFAAYLQYGLPKDNFISLLMAFNVGVELDSYGFTNCICNCKIIIKRHNQQKHIKDSSICFDRAAGLFWF